MDLENCRVGILAAAAIGAELTQTTLDSFHTAGIELNTRGIGRIQELINNSTTLPKILFTFSGERDFSKLVCTTLQKILVEEPIVVKEDLWWFLNWTSHFGPIEIPDSCILMKLKFGIEEMIRANFSIQELKSLDFKTFKPLAMSPIFLKNGKLYCEMFVACEFNEACVVKLLDLVISPRNSLKEKLDFMVERVWIPMITNLKLFGIENVEKIVHSEGKTLVVCNSMAVLNQVIHIDPNDVICNKTIDMMNVYGIEVARKCLIEEFAAIMPKILQCHQILLVERMTWTGKITSVSRYTMRTDPDTLKRFAFEEPIRNIKVAAFGAEVDKLKSISSCIVASKRFIQFDKNQK